MVSKFEKIRRNYRLRRIAAFNRPFSNITLSEKNGVCLFSAGKNDGENRVGNVCAVLSGGPAPGGHNVICGIRDSMVKYGGGVLYGALSGPSGLVDGKLKVITDGDIEKYRNHGGFDMLGSGRTKLNKSSQFDSIAKVASEHEIGTIVIIGGDDSNTNAALMDEYFRKNGIDICVIGVPKTIDGDLKGKEIEMTFGFDSATRTYAELIGNIENDAVSSRKYYHFIRLMGRSASHITLECALLCQPNVTVIGEEVAANGMSLDDIADHIAKIIRKRKDSQMNYGVVLIPEGIIEFIPDVRGLIAELNDIISANPGIGRDDIREKLTPAGLKSFCSFPAKYQEQLLLKRDLHGNVQVSNIESEKIIAEKVSEKLHDEFFSYQTHFFGYEGRCGFPTDFDATYAYNLGITAYLLAAFGKSGSICFIRNLGKKFKDWKAGGVPLESMITTERRNGKDVKVIEKTLVDLGSKTFAYFRDIRMDLAMNDRYVYQGPIQFGGKEMEPPMSLVMETRK